MEAATGQGQGPPATRGRGRAGPAGLSAAYDLARAGYGVTVFEKADRPGGVLATLIPSFRMDRMS